MREFLYHSHGVLRSVGVWYLYAREYASLTALWSDERGMSHELRTVRSSTIALFFCEGHPTRYDANQIQVACIVWRTTDTEIL